MATMTLRVTGKRRNTPGQRCEGRQFESVDVKADFILEAESIEGDEGKIFTEEIKKLEESSCVEDQVQILKKICDKYLKKEWKQDKITLLLVKLLSYIYLRAEPKNPMKNATLRALQGIPDGIHLHFLSTGLRDALQAELDSPVQVGRLAACLLAALENFPSAVEGRTLVTTATFLATALHLCVSELGKDLSPATSSEVFGYAHLCTRCTIALLQGWQVPLKDWGERDRKDSVNDHPGGKVSDIQTEDDHSNDGSGRAESVLPTIKASITSLLEREETPMDTKSNCGLVLVLLGTVLGDENSWAQYLEQVESGGGGGGVAGLSIAAGLLSSLPASQLLQPAHTALDGPRVIVRIYEAILDTINRAPSDSAVVLAGARTVQLLCRQLRQHADAAPDAVAQALAGLVPGEPAGPDRPLPLLDFLWTHLEHCADSVRHAARLALHSLVQAAVTAPEAPTVRERVRRAVLETPADRKSRYLALAAVCAEAGCLPLLAAAPTLPEDLLAALQDRTLAPHVISAYEALMLKHWEESRGCGEEAEQVWARTWVRPLLPSLEVPDGAASGAERLVATAARACPAAFVAIGGGGGGAEAGGSGRAVLAWLRVAHRQGALDARLREGAGRPGLWKGVLSYGALEDALLHENEETRMSALSLLVEGHRSTEPFSPAELQLVRTFLRHNVNVQEPSARQRGLALIKKLLERLRDSWQSLERQVKAAEKSGEGAVEAEKALATASLFLQWLVEFSFSSIFPGANFSRRGSALQILTLCTEIMGERTPADMWLPCNGVTLLECLKDTYENNKLLAHRLIIKYPPQALQLEDETQCLTLLRAGLTLCESSRPPDSVTAAYLLATLARFTTRPSAVRRAVDLESGSENPLPLDRDSTYEDMILAIVKLLQDRLIDLVNAANRNLLEASATHPMYGPLFCIRHLLQGVDFRGVSSDPDWQEFMQYMIELAFEACKAVEEVVNSSSPEGHLPMDFTPAEDLLRRLQQQSAEQDSPVTFRNVNCSAQMLLLCSWRTVKEVSLLLGDIAERAPVASGDSAEGGLVKEAQLLAIGAHLTKLLSETKHRGAFEQAYVGFSSLCRRLWSGEPRSEGGGGLHRLPPQWLRQLLTDVREGAGDATRRSAGLPFMVQALVSTEAQARGCGARSFQDSMDILLGLALDDGSVPEARTHALNILRALFRNSQLGELVTPHVTSGFEAALGAFHSGDWAVRNSGTLLFAALMTRVFGVQRTRGCGRRPSARNRMTGRVFFQRFPRLYDVLLREADRPGRDAFCLSLEAARGPGAGSKGRRQGCGAETPALLLLLARLYPSSLEGTDSNLQLSAYVPFVLDCARSSVYKTRVLAAQALVPLITPDVFEDTLDRLFGELRDMPEDELNYRHGVLLQLAYLISATPAELASEDSFAGRLTSRLRTTEPTRAPCLCPTADSARLALLQAAVSRVSTSVNACFRSDLRRELSAALGLERNHEERADGSGRDDEDLPSWSPGVPQYEKAATSLLLYLSVLDSSDIQMTLLRLLNHPSYDVIEVTLNFLLRNVFEDYLYEVENEEELEFEIVPVKLSAHEVRGWPAVATRISELAGIPAGRGRATRRRARESPDETRAAALLVLRHLPPAPTSRHARAATITLLDVARVDHFATGRAALAAATATYAGLVAAAVQVPSNVTRGLCSLLMKYSIGSQRLENRRTAAYLLYKYRGLLIFPEQNRRLPSSATCSVWTATMQLVDDDDADVRQQVSALVPGRRMPVVAHWAREALMAWIAQSGILEPHHLGALLCAWALGSSTEIVRDVPDEEGIFEQSESNEFREGAALCELACSHLRVVADCTGRELLLRKQDPCMRGWLAKWWFLPEGIFSTLYEFLGLVIKPPPAPFENEEVQPPTVCDHFVAPPGTAKVYLTKYRARCVREVLADLLGETPQV
ncbi:thyroid adenoma-associated protein homolog isoform X1 [Schistocerca gregaria]|uniref:thyroid adenoma-associated protein homolog isoform X1 n=1 Tax=Schistocerca gregaria TaxID=7010 RepID=UPI00211F1187|nr:thyroid adenoma-associated protein homolog isoform X1 [Schistocerca gregaria]